MGYFVRTQLVTIAIITVPAVVAAFLVGLSLGLPRVPPEIPPVDAVPVEARPGRDAPALARYPGAVRVKYENHVLGHVLGETRRWEVGYFAESRVEEAKAFYRKRLQEDGWVLGGTHFDAGELDLQARRGDVQMLVEIGQVGELVEIEMEIIEPRTP